jgi:hypothetical protein
VFGPGITKVFTSRWKALAWSAGILLTAYCSVPSSDDTQPAPAKHKAEENPWSQTKS